MSKKISIDQYQLADKLRELVVGHRIVAVKNDTITLDNGTRLSIEGSSDCCAFGDADVELIVESEHVITSVMSEDLDPEGKYGPERARVFLLSNHGAVAQVNQSWDASNGYYFYGLYLTVTEPDDEH